MYWLSFVAEQVSYYCSDGELVFKSVRLSNKEVFLQKQKGNTPSAPDINKFYNTMTFEVNTMWSAT